MHLGSHSPAHVNPVRPLVGPVPAMWAPLDNSARTLLTPTPYGSAHTHRPLSNHVHPLNRARAGPTHASTHAPPQGPLYGRLRAAHPVWSRPYRPCAVRQSGTFCLVSGPRAIRIVVTHLTAPHVLTYARGPADRYRTVTVCSPSWLVLCTCTPYIGLISNTDTHRTEQIMRIFVTTCYRQTTYVGTDPAAALAAGRPETLTGRNVVTVWEDGAMIDRADLRSDHYAPESLQDGPVWCEPCGTFTGANGHPYALHYSA